MKSFNKDIGNYGEKLAQDYLRKYDYIILDKNFRSKNGEIDIIAKDKLEIVFLEIKTRYSNKFGTPREAVNRAKQIRICKTAQYYIFKNKLQGYNFRFDILEVILNYNNECETLEIFKNAFEFIQ